MRSILQPQRAHSTANTTSVNSSAEEADLQPVLLLLKQINQWRGGGHVIDAAIRPQLERASQHRLQLPKHRLSLVGTWRREREREEKKNDDPAREKKKEARRNGRWRQRQPRRKDASFIFFPFSVCMLTVQK